MPHSPQAGSPQSAAQVHLVSSQSHWPFPHEGPHLNPNWDDTFEVGDVFTCEPGLYSDAMRQGMRLENDYLVTETGIENLSPFPMELKL